MAFSFYLPTFSNILLTDSLSHSLSHLNIISSLIVYSFFNNYTFFNIFYTTYHYYNRKNVFKEWTVIHQTWWAIAHELKKKSMFVESVEASTVHLILQIIANRVGYPNRWRCSNSGILTRWSIIMRDGCWRVLTKSIILAKGWSGRWFLI